MTQPATESRIPRINEPATKDLVNDNLVNGN